MVIELKLSQHFVFFGMPPQVYANQQWSSADLCTKFVVTALPTLTGCMSLTSCTFCLSRYLKVSTTNIILYYNLPVTKYQSYVFATKHLEKVNKYNGDVLQLKSLVCTLMAQFYYIQNICNLQINKTSMNVEAGEKYYDVAIIRRQLGRKQSSINR